MARKAREPTPAERREQIYADTRVAFSKLNKGKPLTDREARLLSKMHRTFLELYDVFRPSIKRTLTAQSEEIAALLESDSDDDTDEDEDDE